MSNKRAYTGIDIFRFVAAILVVAVHTFPFKDIHPIAHGLSVSVIGRLAVPFFLMTSGFFLLPELSRGTEKLAAFVKKTALIYAVAIAVYLPINLYAGYFSQRPFLPVLVKDLLFNGTMYHLWYLPGAILGGTIAWVLWRKLGQGKTLAVTGGLYLLGLLGDSYWGLTVQMPVLKEFYQGLFVFFDYTRNGFFLVPVFFAMGAMLREKKPSLTVSLVGFAVSFAAMIGEWALLQKLDWQRHDSMYISLLPAMYFLFSALLCWRGARKEFLRSSALVIYIVHILVIQVVRLGAKVVGLEELLIENNLIHFLAVAVGSIAFAVVFLWLKGKWKREKKTVCTPGTDRAWMELDMAALANNVQELSKLMPKGCKMMPVVKAYGYGVGEYELTSGLHKLGIRDFTVACLDEAIRLRGYGVTGRILVLGYTHPDRAKELKKYHISQTVIDYDYACALEAKGIGVKCHIKVDTGMHRMGFDHKDVEKIAQVFSMKHLHIEGIFSHFCVADELTEESIRFSRMQVQRLQAVLESLREKGLPVPPTHMQGSAGMINYPQDSWDFARAGISLLGVTSTYNEASVTHPKLQPVMSLKARVALVRWIGEGETVSYGRTFTATKDTRIAVIPIGYADGFPRALSGGKSWTLICGKKAPILGRICMDQMMVDVTDIPEVRSGMVATLIGKDGEEELQAEQVALAAGSITNELLSRMGRRIRILTVNGSK